MWEFNNKLNAKRWKASADMTETFIAFRRLLKIFHTKRAPSENNFQINSGKIDLAAKLPKCTANLATRILLHARRRFSAIFAAREKHYADPWHTESQ